MKKIAVLMVLTFATVLLFSAISQAAEIRDDAKTHAKNVYSFDKWSKPEKTERMKPQGRKQNMTLLMLAIRNRQDDIARLLIEKGVDINARTVKGETALALAIVKNCPEIARMLIARGADTNTTFNDGSTVLMLAVRNRQDDIAKLLIEKGADIHAKNVRGETALALAIVKNCPEIARMLIDRGADIHHRL